MSAPFLPNEEQRLLLKACLESGQAAASAWKSGAGGDESLLPSLYANLKRQGVPAPAIEPLKSAYQKAWTENQQRLTSFGLALQALNRASIKVVVLRGAALSLRYYRDMGARPFRDVDALVHPKNFGFAMKILQTEGWRVAKRVAPAEMLEDSKGRKLNLHWQAFRDDVRGDAEPLLWENSVPVTAFGSPALALHPAHELVMVLMRGVAWTPRPAARWAADAMVLLRETPQFEWELFLDQSRRAGAMLACQAGLAYLKRELGAPVPEGVLDFLGAAGEDWKERLRHRHALTPYELRNPAVSLWLEARRYASGEGRGKLVSWPVGFLKHWASRWRPVQA